MKGFRLFFKILLIVAISGCLVVYYTKRNIFNHKSIFSIYLNNMTYESKMSNINDQLGFINKKKYNLNKRFLINNNLAQFSSYLIVDESSIKMNSYKIEVFVHLNFKFVRDFDEMDNFKCLVKIEETANDEMQIIELDTIDAPELFWKNNKKLVFALNLDQSLIYKQNKENFDLNNIFIAVIWKNDFHKNLTVERFRIPMGPSNQILPYSLIKYQIPTILRSIEPRLKSVSLCAHYIYQVPTTIITWLDTHLSFKVEEIMIYDGTPNGELAKILHDNFGEDERINVVPFKIKLADLCSEAVLFEQYSESDCPLNLRNYLIESCKIFFLKEFSEPIKWRWYFEQITGNDCFTVLSRKHEFIGRYDVDEYVRPRSLDLLKHFYYKNDEYDSICSSTPFFYINTSNSFEKCFYNYIKSIVESNLNGRDLAKLSSIRFDNVLYMSSKSHEARFVSSIGNLIEKVNETTKFPLYLYLSDKNGYSFTVEKEDVDYIRYLFKTFNSFISPVYEMFLKNITTIDTSLVRYFYISIGRKEIHYYKNVKSVYHHNHLTTEKDSWYFNASFNNGHFVGHFRGDPSWLYDGKLSGSIRKFNFDFEHIFYLLKKFTKYCDNLK